MWHSGGTPKQRQAFTLIQTVVAAAIVAVLALSIPFVQRSLNQSSQKSHAIKEYIKTKSALFHSLEADLQEAVYVNGDSIGQDFNTGAFGQIKLAGIQDIPDAHGERLIIAQMSKTNISAPVDIEIVGSDLRISFDDPQAHPSRQDQLQAVLDALKRDGLYTLSSQDTVNLITKPIGTTPNYISGEDRYEVFMPNTANLQDSDLKKFFQIAEVDLIQYRVDQGRLVRESLATGKQKIVANKIESLEIGYAFHSTDHKGNPLALPENNRLGNIDDPTYFTTTNCQVFGECVSLADLSKLYITIIPQRESDDESLNDFQVTTTSAPLAFNISRLDEENLGDNADCSATPANRCTARCASVFTSEDPNSPRYKLYGDLDSNYCKCGITEDENGKDVFRAPYSHPKGFPANRHNSSSASDEDRKRWDACAAHYGCDSSAVVSNYPKWRLACSCFRSDPNDPTDDIYETVDGEHRIGSGFDDALRDIAANGADSNYIKCQNWTACQGAYNTVRAKTGGSHSSVFASRCRCQEREINWDGSAGAPNYRHTLSARHLCHLVGGENRCPNTRSRDGKWKLFDPELAPRGISRNLATLCECMHAHKGGRMNEISMTDIDLRVSRASSTQPYLCPNGSVEQGECSSWMGVLEENRDTWGVLDSLTVASIPVVEKVVDDSDNSEVLAANLQAATFGTCMESLCSTRAYGVGCMASNPASASLYPGLKRSEDGGIDPLAERYRSYCKDSATAMNTGLSNERARVLQLITETGSNRNCQVAEAGNSEY